MTPRPPQLSHRSVTVRRPLQVPQTLSPDLPEPLHDRQVTSTVPDRQQKVQASLPSPLQRMQSVRPLPPHLEQDCAVAVLATPAEAGRNDPLDSGETSASAGSIKTGPVTSAGCSTSMAVSV